MRTIVKRIFELASRAAKTARHVVFALLRPTPSISLGLAGDVFRSRQTLLAENALLRQQLIVAERHIKKPMLHRYERAIMVGLAAVAKGWQNAVLECLDHVVVLGEQHLLETLVEYCRYFNDARPHQGIGQLVPSARQPRPAVAETW